MKKMIYALLSLLGILSSSFYMIPFIKTNGLDYKLFIEQMFLNDVSSFFVINVAVITGVLIVYILLEQIKAPVRFSGLAVVGTIILGIGFGLPFYLLLKEFSDKKKTGGLLTYQSNYNRL
jgi:hypothetical protein